MENCRIAARSSTTILGWGGSASAGAAREAKGEARESERERRAFVILESCASAEVDDLGAVIIGFGKGQAEIDLDRAEGRFPWTLMPAEPRKARLSLTQVPIPEYCAPVQARGR